MPRTCIFDFVSWRTRSGRSGPSVLPWCSYLVVTLISLSLLIRRRLRRPSSSHTLTSAVGRIARLCRCISLRPPSKFHTHGRVTGRHPPTRAFRSPENESAGLSPLQRRPWPPALHSSTGQPILCHPKARRVPSRPLSSFFAQKLSAAVGFVYLPVQRVSPDAVQIGLQSLLAAPPARPDS